MPPSAESGAMACDHPRLCKNEARRQEATAMRRVLIARKLVVLMLAGAVLAGCAHGGARTGQLAVSDRPPEQFTVTYTTDKFDTGGALSLALADGSVFSGRYQQLGSEDVGTAIALTGGTWDFAEAAWEWSADRWTFGGGQDFSDRAVATLFDARGNSLRCRFRLRYPGGGLPYGATGDCLLPDGTGARVSF
jgi:hypothetical protein